VRRGLIVAILIAASAGVADAKDRVAVLDLITDGVAADVREQFETVMEEALRKAGHEVVSHAAVAEAIAKADNLSDACSFGPCVTPIGRALRAKRLLDARINGVGNSYTFVLTLLETERGTPAAQVTGSCPVCTLAEALTKVQASMTLLERPSAAEPLPLVTREAPRSRRSRAPGAWLLAAGVVAAGAGAAIVGFTRHDEPGWAAMGAGGALALTGIVMLFD
jgi:hypothetical protein